MRNADRDEDQVGRDRLLPLPPRDPRVIVDIRAPRLNAPLDEPVDPADGDRRPLPEALTGHYYTG